MNTTERLAGVQVVIRRSTDGFLFVREEDACGKQELWVFGDKNTYVDALGRWVSVGGALDPGEDVFAAAAREMGEELGIHPDPNRFNALVTAPVFCRQNGAIIGASIVLYEPTDDERSVLDIKGRWVSVNEICTVGDGFRPGTVGENARPTFVVAAGIVQVFGLSGWKTDSLIWRYNRNILDASRDVPVNGVFRDELLSPNIILGET